VAYTNFEEACDRLSQAVDPTQHERLQWERNEGPMLARLVSLAEGALAGRPEFELSEEGATTSVKRFVLKVHSKRVLAITIRLEGREAQVNAEAIERSPYRVAAGAPCAADYAAVDEAWMAGALQELFERVG
jgi:hypothetical protein